MGGRGRELTLEPPRLKPGYLRPRSGSGPVEWPAVARPDMAGNVYQQEAMPMRKTTVAQWSDLKPLEPAYALVAGVDLVVVRWQEGDQVSVLYGRCAHRGALMSDGRIEGGNIVCGLHDWDYSYRSGISSYNPAERLHRFNAWLEDGEVRVDANEIDAWALDNPQPYDRDAYQGLYKDHHGGPEEPHYQYIQHLAEHGLSRVGHHGRVSAMGVPRDQLPRWEDIQILTAQLHRVPLLDEHPVGTEVVIGPNAARPLRLETPLFVSDLSFGALSEEAKVALAMGAELAGTGICSGEGGMLPDEQASNSRYLYELASARFGYSMDKVQRCQAFHFKCGQGAKTGTGGHLPGHKVIGEIAKVRELQPGMPAISPARFPEWTRPEQIAEFATEVRERTGGDPRGLQTLGATNRGRSRRRPRSGRGLCDPRWKGRRYRGRPQAVPGQHLGADDPGVGAGTAPSRRRRCLPRHARHHRRPAGGRRLRQGNGSGGGRRGRLQFGNAGDRLHWHACLRYEQLPGRHCHSA